MKFKSICFATMTLFAALAPGLRAHAAEEPFAVFGREILARAQADECFNGIGNNYLPGAPGCANGGIPKVNQSYVWGMAKSGDDLWFGTVANTLCLVLGSYLGATEPSLTASYVCEFGQSMPARYNPALPDAVGDFRPPRINVYNTATGTLTDLSFQPGLITGLTVGIRSAGTMGDTVFLGGPSLSAAGGVNLFAFNTATRAYLGQTTLPGYKNIRKWLVVDGVLYTGVQTLAGEGRILRWTGSSADPFEFVEVGAIDGDAVELALHEGRLFTTTWPVLSAGSPKMAGLWMSPPIPEGGLTADHAQGWRQVWRADDYEPDPLVAYTYGGGALASYDGYLYWGTMHVPLMSTVAFYALYGDPGEVAAQEEIVRNTWRSVAIFRGRNFAEARNVQLLYGEAYLPQYSPVATPLRSIGWEYVRNNMGYGGIPRFGKSGFGNVWNNYTWTMTVFDNQLLVGTMDGGYVIDDALAAMTPAPANVPGSRAIVLPSRAWGADLYRFVSSDYGAIPESLNGLGNHANYGLRTTVVAGDELYVGTANPMNLMTDPAGEARGGWELLRLTARAGVFPPRGPAGTEFSITTLTGYGKQRGRVYLGGREIQVLAWNSRAIHCRLSRKPVPGTYDLRIVTPTRTIRVKQAFTVTQ